MKKVDVSDENMTSKEMLEKIAELDHSRSQLKLRNTEMRHLLDAADDEMTVLRSGNEALRKQVKTLEQMIVDVQHVEAQPCRLPLGDDLHLKQSTKVRQQELVGDGKEHNAMMEQNKNLIAEVQRFQEQREKDMMSLSKFSVALKNSEFRTEEAQIGLQQRDEVIQQNKLQLKQAEETIEEYSTIIKDLRLTNQELRTQLEDTENEASLATLSDFLGEKQALPISRMSFAEEVKLLAEIKKEENEAEEPTSPPIYHQTSRMSRSTRHTTRQRAPAGGTVAFSLKSPRSRRMVRPDGLTRIPCIWAVCLRCR
ncbi:cytadherence high molecular weight protein 2-like [Phycodurus eques]|uniref:cytadherence high molecular weight protein 2-like n=1 Tax=Phycodurus eques TaxID=693459 RepID=UPI002ACD9032|nr:cytadherence high molecular weight protein 2-like [Phycodurus eques]